MWEGGRFAKSYRYQVAEEQVAILQLLYRQLAPGRGTRSGSEYRGIYA